MVQNIFRMSQNHTKFTNNAAGSLTGLKFAFKFVLIKIFNYNVINFWKPSLASFFVKTVAYATWNRLGSLKNNTEYAETHSEYELMGSGFKNDLFWT